MNSRIRVYLLLIFGVSLQQVTAQNDQESAEKFKKFAQDCQQTFDDEQLRAVTLLRESVSEANSNYNLRIPSSPLSVSSLELGVWYFMVSGRKTFENSKRGKKEYDTKFDNEVEGICRTVISKLEPISSDFDHLVENQGALIYLDPDSLDWLATSRICLGVLDNRVQLRKNIYELIIEREHGTRIGRTFHRLSKYF